MANFEIEHQESQARDDAIIDGLKLLRNFAEPTSTYFQYTCNQHHAVIPFVTFASSHLVVDGSSKCFFLTGICSTGRAERKRGTFTSRLRPSGNLHIWS